MHAFCCPLSNLSSPTPSPAQLSPAWVSIRGSWQHSKLVHTLLSRPVDFAIYLLTLCPANSQRWKFSCVKSINHVRAAVPWAVLCPSTHVCLKQLPLSLDNTPPVKRVATRALLFRWPPFSPSWAAAPILRYHRNLSATASSYLSTAVQRDIPSLDIWPSCLSVVFWMTAYRSLALTQRTLLHSGMNNMLRKFYTSSITQWMTFGSMIMNLGLLVVYFLPWSVLYW